MALRREVVDLVGLGLLDQAHEVRAVAHVPVMEYKAVSAAMGVSVQMVNSLSIEGRSSSLHAVDLVSLLEEELGEVGAVLPRDAGDQRFLHVVSSASSRASFGHVLEEGLDAAREGGLEPAPEGAEEVEGPHRPDAVEDHAAPVAVGVERPEHVALRDRLEVAVGVDDRVEVAAREAERRGNAGGPGERVLVARAEIVEWLHVLERLDGLAAPRARAREHLDLVEEVVGLLLLLRPVGDADVAGNIG